MGERIFIGTATEVTEDVAAEQCCEPECGPTTCEPSAMAAETPGQRADATSDECCEPECGPSTCDC